MESSPNVPPYNGASGSMSCGPTGRFSAAIIKALNSSSWGVRLYIFDSLHCFMFNRAPGDDTPWAIRSSASGRRTEVPARFHFYHSTPDCYLVHNRWIPPQSETAHPPALPCLPRGPPACARIGPSRQGCNFARALEGVAHRRKPTYPTVPTGSHRARFDIHRSPNHNVHIIYYYDL